MLKGINNILFTFSVRNPIRIVGIWMTCFFHLLNRPRFCKMVLLFTFLILNGWINHTHKSLSIFLGPIGKGMVNVFGQPLVVIINLIAPTICKLSYRYHVKFMFLHGISVFIRHIFYWQKLVFMSFCVRCPNTVKIFGSLWCQSY